MVHSPHSHPHARLALPPSRAKRRSRGGEGPAIRARLRLLEAQNAVLELVARDAPADRSIGRLLDCLALLLPCDYATAHILGGDRSSDRTIVGAAAPPPAAVLDIPLRPAVHPVGVAAARREPIILGDIAAEPRWPEFRRAFLAAGVRAIWTHPILGLDGEGLCVLAFMFTDLREASPADLALLDALTPLAQLAIEHDRRGVSLHRADQQIESLAKSLPGVVYQRVVTVDGDIFYTYISDGAREIFGVSPAEILADPNALFECLGADYKKDFRERLVKASRELRLWDVEAPIIARDGTRRWTHARARPTRQPDGSVVWNGIILDATRLKESNLALAAASRAKSEFLANMSHELRTPLNAIIGFSEIMRDEHFGPLGNERYRAYAANIRNSGAHLLSIVSDVLDLANIEVRKTCIDAEPLDLRQVVEAAIRIVHGRAEEHRIELSVTIEEEAARIRADGRKLKQILLKLLSNAVKFTPEGGRVTLTASRQPQAGVVISVSDTGIGIDPARIPFLCEPFQQADAALTRKEGGTGLGLPLAKAMVELHGGSLTIDSRVGVGTTVRVTLPAPHLDSPK